MKVEEILKIVEQAFDTHINANGWIDFETPRADLLGKQDFLKEIKTKLSDPALSDNIRLGEEPVLPLKTKDYLDAQTTSGIKVGDKVKLISACGDYEDGWDNTWMDAMTKNIGRVGEVLYVDELGIAVQFDRNEHEQFGYHYKTLRLV